MSVEEVYNSNPWFQNYSFKRFQEYLATIKGTATKLHAIVAQDEQDILPELALFPRNDPTVHGYPFLDDHPAKALLEFDVRDGAVNDMLSK